MNTYTVIGLYPDGYWVDGRHEASFVERVEADAPSAAARAVRETLAAQNIVYDGHQGEVDDFCVLAVFEGAHEDVYEPSVQAAAARDAGRIAA